MSYLRSVIADIKRPVCISTDANGGCASAGYANGARYNARRAMGSENGKKLYENGKSRAARGRDGTTAKGLVLFVLVLLRSRAETRDRIYSRRQSAAVRRRALRKGWNIVKTPAARNFIPGTFPAARWPPRETRMSSRPFVLPNIVPRNSVYRAWSGGNVRERRSHFASRSFADVSNIKKPCHMSGYSWNSRRFSRRDCDLKGEYSRAFQVISIR